MNSQAERRKHKAESEIRTCHCEEARRSNLKTISSPFVVASPPDWTDREAQLLSLRGDTITVIARRHDEAISSNPLTIEIASLHSQ